MGKSLKNAVTPDEIYEEYGADTLRVYEMSMGPLDMGRPWNTRDIVGAHRLLQRAWRAVVDESTGDARVVDEPVEPATAKVLARAVHGVAEDYAALRFNTAVAKVHELVNHVTKLGRCPRAVGETLALLLAPWPRTWPRSCGPAWAARRRSACRRSPGPIRLCWSRTRRRWWSRSTARCATGSRWPPRSRPRRPRPKPWPAPGSSSCWPAARRRRW